MNTGEQFENTPQFTGRHMALIMIAFFGVIIAVNLTMATMASKSWTGLIVKNSYVASQEFNRELAQAEAQRASGLASDLTYYDGTLFFALKDREGARLAATNLTAEIGRPAFEQADRTISFLPARDNSWTLSVPLAPGVWALKITGIAGDTPYRRDARIFIDAAGNGRVE